MRIKTIKLENFKRFDHLTIRLGDDPKKIIALVGPNGCGKSSVFDAFEEKTKDYKSASSGNEEKSYFSKLWHSIFQDRKVESYSRHDCIEIIKADDSVTFDKKSFYIRSAYRFSSSVKVNSITAQPDPLDDGNRPRSLNALDSRMQNNYERLLGKLLYEFEQGEKTGNQFREEIIGKINKVLENVIEVKISSLGKISEGKGQLFFEKGNSKDFPYENLSSGEKEVIDIIIDFIMKVEYFDDTVFAIDEPELHLNTSIQRKLLIEIDKIIPDNCQLWVATHSIGFLRALQDDVKDKCQILDFSEQNYFDGTSEIEPIKLTRKNWQRIFKTALEDIAGLVAPQKIIYCEGKLQNSLDEKIFNLIFEETHHESIFIASGNKTDVERYAGIALGVLSRAFNGVNIIALIDRDDDLKTTPKVGPILVKKLSRREFENYLLDKEILKIYCANKGFIFNEINYNTLVLNIVDSDVKSIANDILEQSCSVNLNRSVKEDLARIITPLTAIYVLLESEIFN